MNIKILEVTLPNGTKSVCTNMCKAQVSLGLIVARKISFSVFDMYLPFILGVLFLKQERAIVCCWRRTALQQQLQGQSELAMH